MITEKNKRSQIISRVKSLPNEQLDTLDLFIKSLEKAGSNETDVLSFAGIFKNMNPEIWDDLTNSLHEKRIAEPQRIPEF